MKQLMLSALATTLLGLSLTVSAQNGKPKAQEAKKSESSCDNYAEFKKKQKAARGKKSTDAGKQEAKK